MPLIRNDRAALDRRLGKRVYLCSFKDFYCEHAKKDQTAMCQECPVEEEQLKKARKTIRDHLEKGSKKIQF